MMNAVNRQSDELAGNVKQSVVSVRPSVRLFVCLFVCLFVSILSSQPSDLSRGVFVCVSVMTLARL